MRAEEQNHEIGVCLVVQLEAVVVVAISTGMKLSRGGHPSLYYRAER